MFVETRSIVVRTENEGISINKASSIQNKMQTYEEVFFSHASAAFSHSASSSIVEYDGVGTADELP